jgi:CubicO group peptidase (beta-lactamase class C family)
MPNFPRKLISVFSILTILTLLAGIVFMPPSAGSARSAAYAAKLETYLLNQMDTYHIPGLAIAIVRDGAVEYLNGLGTANEQGDKVTPDTPFLLASVSKAITALGIMQLVEAGKLNLDDPVQKYLPWFKVNGDGAEKMTVAHLLYQTSGFSEAAGLEANLIPDGADALETGVRDLAGETLLFPPGEDWQYSNLNYNVLGLLIQEISGQTYESYIEDFIFAPLGMSRSYTSLTAARAGGAASGYYPFFGFPLNFDRRMPYTRATLPAGGLWSTAADMSRYMIALLNEGSTSGGFILTPQNVARLFEPGFMFDETQGYAMGWTNNNGFMPAEQLVELGSSLQDMGLYPCCSTKATG